MIDPVERVAWFRAYFAEAVALGAPTRAAADWAFSMAAVSDELIDTPDDREEEFA